MLICTRPNEAGMGTRVPRQLSEFGRYGLDVGARCRKCGRMAVYLSADIARYFFARRLDQSLPVKRHPFVCRCGSRDVEIIPVERELRPSTPDVAQPLVPIYVKSTTRLRR